MLYDRVMRNIQNRHKDIKHMNSFINVRRQRKLRKFLKNPLSGSQVSGLTFRIPGPTYELGPGYWVSGLRSWVSPLVSRVSGPASHLWDGSLVSGPTKSPRSCVPFFGYVNSMRTGAKNSVLLYDDIYF